MFIGAMNGMNTGELEKFFQLVNLGQQVTRSNSNAAFLSLHSEMQLT